MTLPEHLLRKVACPKCRGPLAPGQQIDKLTCSECRLAFRVTDDIPVLLLDEAEKMES